MRQVVAEAIRAGALGFSSDRGGFHLGDGGRPVPSIVGSRTRLEAADACHRRDGQGIVHVSTGEHFAWVYDFQRAVGSDRSRGRRSSPTRRSGSRRAPYRDKLVLHAEGRAAGADVWVQVTCRPILQELAMIEPTAFYSVPAFPPFVAEPLERPCTRSTRIPRGDSRRGRVRQQQVGEPAVGDVPRRRLRVTPELVGRPSPTSRSSAVATRSTSSPTSHWPTTSPRASA